ncbi:MAG: efflux RND transporter periplasmic adaptor subunit [Planctomycetota bacterium]
MNRVRTCSAFKNVALNRSVAAPVIEPSNVRCVSIFVLLALMFAAWMPVAGGQGSATIDLVAVKTTQPKQITLRRATTQPATVRAFFEAELYAKVGGYLKKLYVDIGDQVEEGQKLAEIDVPEMLKAYERQEAEVTRLQSEKVRYDAAIEVARAKLEQAQAGVKKAEARVTADGSEYKRIEELVESKATTQRLSDETLNRLQASEAALSSQKANYKVAQAELKVALATAESAEAAKEVAQKQLEEYNVLIGYATLRAPFDGIVTNRTVDPGDLVQNGQSSSRAEKKPLFTIVQIDKVRVKVPIPERDVSLADVGDEAQFKHGALPGGAIEGKIARISKSLDPITRTMMVEIDFPNPGHKMLPGMFGQMIILLEESSDRFVLPAACIHNGENDSECHVCVVDSSNKVRYVPVTTGLDDGHQIEIVSGLTGEEQVVLGMLGRLLPNQAVKVLR